MNFLNALERIPKLVEQYREKNIEYERDIPILQQTVGGVWKKEDELKQLKSEVAALERKIQLELAPPKTEVGQEPVQGDGKSVQNTTDMPNGSGTEPIEGVHTTVTVSPPSGNPDTLRLSREHIYTVKPKPAEDNMQGKGLKL